MSARASAARRASRSSSNVTSGGGVVPAQLALFPSQVQVEDGAVALVGLIAGRFNHDGLVDSFDEPVSCQGRAVVLAPGGVESPVLGDSQGSVAVSLFGDIAVAGAG